MPIAAVSSQPRVEPEAQPPPQPMMLTLDSGVTVNGPDTVGITLERAFVSVAEDGKVKSALIELRLNRPGDSRRPTDIFEIGRGDAPETRTWCGLRLTFVSATPDEKHVTLRIEGRYALAPVVRVARGQRTKLADDFEITFTSHSHKHTSGDTESPLMVNYLRHRDEGHEVSSISIYTYESRLFYIRPYTFELVDHHYNDWMDVRLISTP